MEDTRNVRMGVGLLVLAFVLVVVWIASRALVGVYIDALWFGALGYGPVFRTMLFARVAFGGIAFVIALAVLVWSILAAYARSAFSPDGPVAMLVTRDTRSPEGPAPLITMDETAADATLRRLLLGVAVLCAAMLGFSAARNWVVFLNWHYAVPFEFTEPVYGHDVGFYVFTLPALAYGAKLLSILLALALVGAFAVYYLRGAILNGQGQGLPPKPFAHLSFVAGLAVTAFALQFWVARFQLLLSKRGAVFGAGYTDVHAHAHAYLVLLVAGLILGGWLIVNARLRRRPANLYALAAFGLLWIAVGHVYPWAVQQFVVRPNEWDCEKDYITRNIEFTRIAYGLDKVRAQAWPGDGTLSADTLKAHSGTTDNLQVWNPAPLQDVFNQKQRIRSYYGFNAVDVDRYTVDGALRPVMIAPRELDLNGLPEKNRVWTNLHLYYTHGYGLCMSFANRAVAGGLPDFLIRDIPPVSTRAPEVAEPRIYFGENTTGYALVDTALDEFDYPGDPDNFFNRYEGTGGLPVGGALRKALLAWQTGDKDILFTEQFSDTSRILLFRQVRARAAKLAPFLFFDEDPYPVLHDGRIVWILDGYTITRRFPYSEALGIANYWRNSVKATVDAYDGTVTFYRADDADPILRVFERMFPSLIRPLDDMPAGLRAHLRYPRDMFRVQTAIYHKYHVDDARVFYNGEDVWTFPRVTEGERTSYEDPRYTVMELPGAESPEEFLLVRSFTVEGKDNMIAWLAGRCDEPHYGELHLYRLPKKRNIYGPNQAKGRFNQDPSVSEFNTLMGQRGSAVIQSKVSAVPIADGLLYLQSLFIEDPEVKIPELKQVVVGHGDRVAMRPTLDEALSALFADTPAADVIPAPPQPGAAPYQRARDLYRQAQERMKSGDWTGFGEAFEALGEALKAAE